MRSHKWGMVVLFTLDRLVVRRYFENSGAAEVVSIRDVVAATAEPVHVMVYDYPSSSYQLSGPLDDGVYKY